MADVLPFDLPFKEAIDYFASKGVTISADSWRDVWQDANARSFTVAQVTSMDVLVDIKGAVQKALDEGTTLRDFKDGLRPLLEQKGWFAPVGEAAKTIGPDGEEIKRLTGWRLDNIFQTNVQTAYSVGRYQQQMEVVEARQFWHYNAVLDQVTRPDHAEQNGKIYDYRHPFWDMWYPQNGFFCRCYVTTLSAEDVGERGLEVETKGTDRLPDEGWRYNVGAAGINGMDDSRFPANPQIATAAAGQANFEAYDRPKITEVEDSLRLPVPGRMPTMRELTGHGATEEDARRTITDGFRSLFAIPETQEGAWISDYEGLDVRVNIGLLDYLLSKGEGREAFLKFIAPTLQDPYEVWLVETETPSGVKLRKRYIGLFERNFLVVADRYREGWGVWDVYPISRATAVDKQREGTLIFSK